MRNLKSNIFNFIYLILEKYFNLHLTRDHFSSPIPNSKDIDDSVYTKVFSLKGIAINERNQLELINELQSKYSYEFTPYKNKGLSLLDSFILYSLIRSKKPKKIVEIGYGATSEIIVKALEKNINNLDAQFYSIDPFIKNINRIKNNSINIIPKKVQDIPINFFVDVDFLLIDSSHVSKIGSDVPFFINGKNQYVEGMGNKLSLLSELRLAQYYILIINPNIHIDTSWAYESLKKARSIF